MKNCKSENKCSSIFNRKRRRFSIRYCVGKCWENGDSSHRNLMLSRLELLLSFVAIFQKPEINQLNVAVSGGKKRKWMQDWAEKIDIFLLSFPFLAQNIKDDKIKSTRIKWKMTWQSLKMNNSSLTHLTLHPIPDFSYANSFERPRNH